MGRALRWWLWGGLAALLGCDDPSVVPTPTGAELYGEYCAVCHGAKGEGYAAPQANALANPDFLAAASEDFLKAGVVKGRPGTSMSAWGASEGGPLSEAVVTELVKHLTSWRRDAPTTLDERPLAGDVARGAALYAERCRDCHGDKGQGGSALSLANPEFLRTATNGYLRQGLRRGRRDTPMSAYQELLGEQELEDVVAFVRGLQAR